MGMETERNWIMGWAALENLPAIIPLNWTLVGSTVLGRRINCTLLTAAALRIYIRKLLLFGFVDCLIRKLLLFGLVDCLIRTSLLFGFVHCFIRGPLLFGCVDCLIRRSLLFGFADYLIRNLHVFDFVDCLIWGPLLFAFVDCLIKRLLLLGCITIWGKKNSMVWVRERTIPTERPKLVGEVIANLCG
jgi:uncharacterized membrane protein YvlD (DUF360 family)